jgi:hypothetical protein
MDADYADRLRVKLGLVNAPSLGLLRERLSRAEVELESARNAMRKAADAGGIARAGLFAGTRFIERTSGERWANEARAEGRREGHEWLATALENARRPDRDRPFRIAGEALARAHREGREFGSLRRDAGDPVNEVDAIQARIRKSREVDLSSNALINAPTTSAELAAGIHEAAAKARTPTGAHRDDKAPMNSLSAAILKAGRRRRSEEP